MAIATRLYFTTRLKEVLYLLEHPLLMLDRLLQKYSSSLPAIKVLVLSKETYSALTHDLWEWRHADFPFGLDSNRLQEKDRISLYTILCFLLFLI